MHCHSHLVLVGSEHVHDSSLKAGGKIGLIETGDMNSSRRQQYHTPEFRCDGHLRLHVVAAASAAGMMAVNGVLTVFFTPKSIFLSFVVPYLPHRQPKQT